MSNESQKLMTVTEIAAALSRPEMLPVAGWRVKRAIERLGLEPARLAGITKLFSSDVLPLIRNHMNELHPPLAEAPEEKG